MTIFNRTINIHTPYMNIGTPPIFSCNNFLPFNSWTFNNWMPTFNFNFFNFNIFNIPFQNFNNTPNFSFNLEKIFPTTNIWDNQQANFNLKANWNSSWNNSLQTNWGDTFTRSNSEIKRNSTSSNLQLALADKAKSYVGKVNSDAEGNRLFSNGKTQAWCADFVSTITRETFKDKLPSSFQHFSAVSDIRSWGENNNCYLTVPSTNKAEFIAKNVKVGDIMIEKNGGKSHTGIVTKVNPDGSFETVEGNCSNKVATQKYQANSPTLSGFVSLDKYTA